jgi:hypothetical protein
MCSKNGAASGAPVLMRELNAHQASRRLANGSRLVADTRSAVDFLVLSGLATGASWLCYFRALKIR